MQPQPLRDKVLFLVRAKGPVLPVHINKEIQRDSFFSGAILSELIAEKVVKISSAKIGGSPVYYVAGQEQKLSILYDHLPMREKEAYNLLKDKKVLLDTEANPGIRVALRMIKDFAVPLRVQRAGREEILWRWYLVSDQEAQTLFQSTKENVVQPSQLQEQVVEKPREVQPLQTTQIQREEQKVHPSPLTQQLITAVKKQQKQSAKIEFYNDLSLFMKKSNLTIHEEHLVRKNREYDFLISIPSNIGAIDYLLVAKNKKTINEADLSLAYQKGQSRKLPVILITNGELTKKAREYREKNLKGYVLVQKV